VPQCPFFFFFFFILDHAQEVAPFVGNTAAPARFAAQPARVLEVGTESVYREVVEQLVVGAVHLRSPTQRWKR
jgi:hypothetical protein